jgi:hypothetical protein
MGAKSGLVVAIVGGLLLHASGARADENIAEPPVPGLRPALEPKPAAPAPTPALSLTEPRMVHKARAGFLITGLAIAAPAYLLQALLTLGYSPTIQTYDQPCSYCAKAQALSLIPIAGPWLASRAAGQPDGGGDLVFAGIEIAALTMIIVGLVGEDVPLEPEGSKVSLAPFVTPQAGGMSLRLRW